ncbi:hypothetical protein [Haliea sp. E17]|uniref:hypothetical protein n=1 Tax=Haliea sp. E17 TaxID=3401576 RepID=UPI003AAEEA2C
MRSALGACSVCLLAFLLTACGFGGRAEPAPIVDSSGAGPGGTACATPRPQVCTMEWAPVCANTLAGATRQYASACNACADDQVTSYQTGECGK